MAQEMQENDYDISRSAHPIAVLFTLLFKAGAVLFYFFAGLFLDSTFKFICVTLFVCFDFWTVKNITGRLLVGLKWDNNFQQDGTEIWEYQSMDANFVPNTVDKSFFWTSLLSFTAFWCVFLVLNIISISIYSICLNLVGFTLSWCNLYGFYKCSQEHQTKMKQFRKNVAKEGFKYMARKQFG
ncbi:hypothetical protein PPERSA_03843 [Pseudocohnilembus persalinus]|uniref:Golgi apparatus membrane protein TVP23 homolog n=1 Tax=Pseudocohnilembus persalinus TaxID=266149 RepID=A0A0V0QUF7_PSEPJ|nr:hypothetical protein PPERSA_03843 [Pseudocohnilembus persalinus]|eukprot:KRX05906.1 hypothetical protein PPERSA_03843 [Pseudocohnilembus persalinus]